MSGTKENDFILLVLCWNVVSGSVADRKAWVSMLLSYNRFTILTHVTFRAFRLFLTS